MGVGVTSHGNISDQWMGADFLLPIVRRLDRLQLVVWKAG